MVCGTNELQRADGFLKNEGFGIIVGSGHLKCGKHNVAIQRFFPHSYQFTMLIFGIALGLFVVGGGLISLTNAMSKREDGSQE